MAGVSGATNDSTSLISSREFGKPESSTAKFYRNVARIGMQIADALAYAHGQRILHRDVKPSNLLLDIHGNAWVTDFGLAKDEDEHLTHTGDVVGTLRYMAPERFQRPADARGDIYSLGLTLYELVTLKSCHPANHRRALVPPDGPRHLPSPRDIDPQVPRDLETIVLKAIAYDPSQRYGRADAMADDLRRFLSDRPILARRTTWAEHVWMWCRRNRLLAGTAAAAAVLLVLSCLGWVTSHILRNQRDAAMRAEQSALAHEHLAKASSHCVSGRSGSRGRALQEIVEAVRQQPTGTLRTMLRDQAIAALAMTDIRVETIRLSELLSDYPLEGSMDFGLSPIRAISPDCTRWAIVPSQQNKVLIVDRSSRQRVSEFSLSEQQFKVAFSKSGSLVVASGGFGGSFLSVWDAATGRRLYYAKEQFGYDISFDDGWLAIGQQTSGIQLIDLHNPRNEKTIQTDQVPQSLAFCPDGTWLAVIFRNRRPAVSIFDGKTLQRIHELDCGASNVIAWHPNGTQLVVCRMTRAEIWDIVQEKRLAVTEDHSQVVDQAALSADGRFLITGCWDGTSRLWDVNSMRQILTLERSVQAEWSPNDQIVGWRTTDDGAELIHLERSPLVLSLPTSQPGDFAMSGEFSSDACSALLSYGDLSSQFGHALDLCHVDTGRIVGTVVAARVSASHFTDHGQWLHVVHGQEWSRLPLQQSQAGGCYGPPESVSLPGPPVRAALFSDGSRCGILYDGKLHVLRFNDQVSATEAVESPPAATVATFDLPYVHDSLAISPDGQWAATWHWHSPVVCLWNLEKGEFAGELRVGVQVRVFFSPTSQQLVTSRWDAYRFWDVHTLKNALTLHRSDCPQPDPIAIAPNGRLAVACLQPGELDLMELPSGSTIARLRRPNQGRDWYLAFDQRGTRILEGSVADNLVAVWDLRALQRELTALGLGIDDWEMAADEINSTPVQHVVFEGIEPWSRPAFIGSMTETEARKRLDLLQRAVQLNPNSALAANNLAWALTMAPPALRDADRAVELAEEAMRLESENTTYRNTLAAAYLRAGRYTQAIEELQKNVGVTADDQLPWDLFLLSLCHSEQHQSSVAREYFRMGLRWMHVQDGDKPLIRADLRPELEYLRDEAEAACSSRVRE